jgi:xyloglucan-specific exo-beta-1,4-glucanase
MPLGNNVKIGGGGGFTPGIVFNPTTKGIAYARTDIGGLYRLNADDSWTPLQDYVDSSNWYAPRFRSCKGSC